MFQEITDELAESVDNLNYWQRQIRMHSIEKIRQALGGRKSTLSHIPTGQTFVNLPDRSIEVLETDTVADIKAKLANPFERQSMSAIDRVRAKAMQARGVAPAALKAFEADLDSILAEEAVINQKRAEAVAPHMAAIAGVKGELDGLKSAIDILSND